ncbi:polysaccharide deacetylase family protein [Candidatus Woesebacteria bacterium]|nr:polysaccharide deacetylase family protein [Candidatus Woesebacteria bacterium]
MKKKDFLPFLLLVSVFLIGISALFPQELAEKYKVASTPTPTATPRPLTFAEMNELYGPCVALPTLMYHHIQDKAQAEEKNQLALTVETETFKNQMEYLKARGYGTLGMDELIAFFDQEAPIPKGSVLLTFDDGYDDFYKNALPILEGLGLKATIFVSSGLMDNRGYLTWTNISQATPSAYLFANHTWSHKNMQTTKEKIKFEILTADMQLAERALNSPKVFAYPYGLVSDYARKYLQELGYKLAFGTKAGSTLCKKQRFELPRVRVGNTSLSNYGF